MVTARDSASGPWRSSDRGHAADRGGSADRGHAAGSEVSPLAGFTVALATDRRNHEMAAWLAAEGARTIGFRAVHTTPQPDPAAIAAAVRETVAQPVHEVIVSSAYGLRLWLAAARREGLLDQMVTGLAEARLLARNAVTADGLRELGLTQIWSTAAATTEDLFRYLIAQPMTGRRVVAQIEVDAHRELCQALREAGASVVEVPTHQFGPPTHADEIRRLNDLILRRHVDAVVLGGPAVTDNVLDQARADGVLDDVLNALVHDVPAICLGPLTAAGLAGLGIPVVRAAEPVPRSLAARVLTELPQRALALDVGGRKVEIRGQAVVVDGALIPVQAGPMAVLRALATHPGRVLSAAEIRAYLPYSSTVDDHAIEMAVSRLRGSLGHGDVRGPDLIQTVVKRGYRLAV
ncbi:MAG: uroporphyrinogen-III synthase [Micromonosporaceae bacterium]|nr:uroporphyrinogen-III synthase [Micromonosporaceae bacterium]